MPKMPLTRYVMAKIEEAADGSLVVHLNLPQDQLKADEVLLRMAMALADEATDVSIAPHISGPGQTLARIPPSDTYWYDLLSPDGRPL